MKPDRKRVLGKPLQLSKERHADLTLMKYVRPVHHIIKVKHC